MQMKRSLRSQRGWAWLSAAAPYIASAVGAIGGALIGRKSQGDATEQNTQLQREFAQQGIRWRVADAKAAGIHPLYALGASPVQFSPTAVGDTGMPNAVNQMGQDLSRAMLQGKTQPERNDELAMALARANLRNMELRNAGQEIENAAAASALMRSQQQVGPAVPTVGGVSVTPSEQISAKAGMPGLEAADTPGFKRYGVGYGSIDLPNSQMSEALEGMGAAGHVVTPLVMWNAARDREMQERSDSAAAAAARGDRAYLAALAEAQRIGGYVERGRVNGVWGWVVKEKRKDWPRATEQEKSFWKDRLKNLFWNQRFRSRGH